MNLIERFRYVMKLNSITASQFADEVGVQRSSVSHILSGRNKPSLEFIQKVLNRFPKVDSTWLINGKTNIGTAPKETEEKIKVVKPIEVSPEPTIVDQQKETVELKATSESDKSKYIKKIVVFYSDGTFEELVS